MDNQSENVMIIIVDSISTLLKIMQNESLSAVQTTELEMSA